MPEVITEMILPGTYIEVRAEGLIAAGPISVGNIGVVGTAKKGTDNEVVCLSSWAEAKEAFGEYDSFESPTEAGNPLSLSRALELIFNNGGRTVYAVKTKDLTPGEVGKGLDALIKFDAHIVVAAGLDADTIGAKILGHCDTAVVEQKERIGIVGSKTALLADIKKGAKPTSDRLIYVAPGIKSYDTAAKRVVALPGGYAACAVAGLVSSLAVQSSPTNKVMKVEGLEDEYTYSQLKELIDMKVCALSRKNGSFVVTKGITTDIGAFQQITTRRIVDKAKAGIRSGSQPYIGKLNNSRVRSALKSTLDGFLTTMVQDEALTEYSLEVTATRADEISGRCMVTITLKPTFSIDYIKVIMYLS